MFIETYADALLAVALKLPSAQVEVANVDLTIKPTNYLQKHVVESLAERAILDRQAHIHFE